MIDTDYETEDYLRAKRAIEKFRSDIIKYLKDEIKRMESMRSRELGFFKVRVNDLSEPEAVYQIEDCQYITIMKATSTLELEERLKKITTLDDLKLLLHIARGRKFKYPTRYSHETKSMEYRVEYISYLLDYFIDELLEGETK